MLTNLAQAPVIADETFSPTACHVINREVVTLKGEQCVWITTQGTMWVNDDEWDCVASLVPLGQLGAVRPGQKIHDDTLRQGLRELPEEGIDVFLIDEFGTGLLNSLCIVLREPKTGLLAAHVFNGYADELCEFEPEDTMLDVMDTVRTMFAVLGGGQ